MASLKKIWIEETTPDDLAKGFTTDKHSLCMLWDNGRYQSIGVNSLEPKDISTVLASASMGVHNEHESGFI